MTEGQQYLYNYLRLERGRLADRDAEEGLYEYEEEAFCLICKVMRMLKSNEIINDKESMTEDYVLSLTEDVII
jgi:hypothetical protein